MVLQGYRTLYEGRTSKVSAVTNAAGDVVALKAYNKASLSAEELSKVRPACTDPHASRTIGEAGGRTQRCFAAETP